MKYAHVFHDEETNDFKGTNIIEHEILVGDARPIRRPQYRTPFALRDEMKAQVENVTEGRGKTELLPLDVAGHPGSQTEPGWKAKI